MSLKPGFIDLFCGCGGLSLGFLQAGFRCLLAVDNDPKAISCYNANLTQFDDNGAISFDLSRISSAEDGLHFLKERGIAPGDCKVLAGGPPCQSFSRAGRRKIDTLIETGGDLGELWQKRDQERVMLFEAFACLLEALKPHAFLFENVPDIQKHAVFRLIMDRFSNLRSIDGEPLSYGLYPDVYWASDYGVPQKRRRFILIGIAKDKEGWVPPLSKPPISVGEAILDLPEIPNGNKVRVMEYTCPPNLPYQKAMRGNSTLVSDHVCWRHSSDDESLFREMRQCAKFSDPDVQEAIRRINSEHKLLKYATNKFGDKLHRLSVEKPAWTVTAHLQKDCYKFIHPTQARTISVREAARFQSFPDTFKFDMLTISSAYKCIGNAVPPFFAEAFAKTLKQYSH